jgi:hypothetical protein
MGRIAHGFGMDQRLAKLLAAADVPLTVSEIAFGMLAIGVVGFVVGATRVHPLAGVAIGAIGAFLPVLYLKFKQGAAAEGLCGSTP